MDYNEICTAMQELDEASLLELMNKVINEKGDAYAALKACQDGMEEVGRLFEEGEYFSLAAAILIRRHYVRLRLVVQNTNHVQYCFRVLLQISIDKADIVTLCLL